MPMKIVTFLKSVPTQAATPKIAPSRDHIEDEGISYEVNEADLYAVEEAVAQKLAHKGSVVAVTIGAAQAKDGLAVAYAKGVDQAIHVLDVAFQGNNLVFNVQAAAQIVGKQNPALIFTGIQAEDDLQGQFGIALAEVLGLPVVTAVTGVTVDSANKVATVIRELGSGIKQEIEVDLPCVITVQFGIRQLRYVPIMSIFKMRSRAVETIASDDLGVPAAAMLADGRMRIVELSYPEEAGHCQIIDGPPEAAARNLVNKLVDAGVL